jgi:predicted helicase
VKFIRFAQMKMDGFTYKTKAPDGKPIEHSVLGVERGIVGVITNHSWLDNPTFRGMRQSLMRSFEQIYVLDLHGNAEKKERAPNGSDDQNVFDIEQGVAISLFVKRAEAERGVWRCDFWGKRLAKYQACAAQKTEMLPWQRLEPARPDFLFLSQDYEKRDNYNNLWKITDIFGVNSVGIVTARDDLSIHFDKIALLKTVTEFTQMDVEAARRKYLLGDDAEDWRVAWAQNDLRDSRLADEFATQILYRPFDPRWTYYTGKSRGFLCRPRTDVMRHMLGENVSIITTRITKDDWAVIASNTLSAHKSASRYDISYVLPLWLYPPFGVSAGRKLHDAQPKLSRIENLTTRFRIYLDAHYEHHYTPEEIFGYIYAILHGPSYRDRYAEFLRIEFPRVPFPDNAADFENLSRLGWALVEAHLLRNLPRSNLAAYHGKGDHAVEFVRYSEAEQSVAINKTQSFQPVLPAVWNFHIGGYQVLDKYLKSRKGRKLSLDEIDHVAKVADSLAFTSDQMARIDEAYRAAFP